MRNKQQGPQTITRIAAVATPIFFFFLLNVSAIQAFTGKPTLSVPIPNVKLTDLVTKAEGDATYLYIPWLAQYIAGVYKYALGIAVVIAAVMAVIGGFQYATGGGDASRVKAGKDRISQAIIGLVLLFGSYMLLNTISPSLLTLDVIKIVQVKKQPFDPIVLTQTSLATTNTDTGTQAGADAAGQQTSAGAPKSTFADCPLPDLPAPKKDDSPNGARSRAFRDGITALPNLPADLRPRIAAVAEASVRCQVRMGSCGTTAGSIWTIAGIGKDELGKMSHGTYGTTRWGSPAKTYVIPTKISLQSLAIPCGAECPDSEQMRKLCNGNCDLEDAKEPPPKNKDGTTRQAQVVRRNCAKPGAEAKQRLREIIEEDPSMKGWPDSWTNQLEIGDVIVVYNGNSSCGSAHAQVFLGWASEGKARLANGQWKGPLWFSTECLKRSCGNFAIVINIFKPKQLVQ